MKQPLFTGTCTALVTPFLDGKVNYPMLEVLLRRQVDVGIRAIVVCGTTGEGATLTDEEKIKITRISKEIVGSQCKIITGTGSNNTSHAVDLSVAAMEAGADALLCVSPYYNKATDSGLVDHYSAIAEAVRIPVILYNVPSRTGLDIPVSVYRILSAIPSIAGVKEATASVSKICRIKAECPQDFYIWSGNDDLTVPIMAIGGKGVISVVSNVAPELTQAMTVASLSGDFETAAAIQLKLIPLIDALFAETNPIPVKAAMKMIGFDCGNYRLPLTNPGKSTIQALESLL